MINLKEKETDNINKIRKTVIFYNPENNLDYNKNLNENDYENNYDLQENLEKMKFISENLKEEIKVYFLKFYSFILIFKFLILLFYDFILNQKKFRDKIIIKQNEFKFKLEERINELENEARKFILEDNPSKKMINELKKVLNIY